MSSKRLLKEAELSAEFGIPVNTLRADRRTTRRVPFIRLGRAVYYDPVIVTQALGAQAIGGKKREAKAAGGTK